MAVRGLSAGVLFDELQVWMDPVARSGPETMAVDEWLLETAEKPVLRVYRWLGDWGSIGYFGNPAEAKVAIPGVEWIRRWTGGGAVDHRADWTYTIVSPAGVAIPKGAESYRIIHAALAGALRAEGVEARLSGGENSNESSVCFVNPVSHDILNNGGEKIAGAGQRRTRMGLLHQGSVAVPMEERGSVKRASLFSEKLSKKTETIDFEASKIDINRLLGRRYARADWMVKIGEFLTADER